MTRWVEREALCLIGGRWWVKDTEAICALLLREAAPKDLAEHLVTDADTSLFAEFVKAAKAAASEVRWSERRPSDVGVLGDPDDDTLEQEDARFNLEEPAAAEVPPGAELAVKRWPSLAEYERKWTATEAHHTREVPGDFSLSNLVPMPVPQLWQDAPHVPFARLKRSAAAARLSVCRPLCDLQTAHGDCGGTYAHITGDVVFRRRAPLQLASTMGFVLNKREGDFMGLTENETSDVHECLTWGRQRNNNKHLEFAATVFEEYLEAVGPLFSCFDTLISEGCPRVRIQMSTRDRNRAQALLPETLGKESMGLVVIDPNPTGLRAPMSFEQLELIEHVAALRGDCGLELSVPGPDGKGWRRMQGRVCPAERPELGQEWLQKCARKVRAFGQHTKVRLNDPHYDAQVFVAKHPYGTGSLLSEPHSGGIQSLARSRLCAIDSQFRKDPLWGFFQLDRLHKSELFFREKARRDAGRPSASRNEEDPYKRLFGQRQPAEIPETTEWWQRQQKDLFALTDSTELGMFQTMTTISHNDSCPEMLAVVRRGPGARPRDHEMIEYLMGHKPKTQERPVVEEYALEHVLSFQRRVVEFKRWFMRRGEMTPLGSALEWWDRTEAQVRAALHAHIPTWFEKRLVAERDPLYERLPSIPREARGHDARQRPRSQIVRPRTPYQEDHFYHTHRVGRVNAQMVRPNLAKLADGTPWGGYDLAKLRMAGLARAIQTKLYLHVCSRRYCLKNRGSCRFFFPWPQQPQQQYDENTDRVALERLVPEDDQWVVPHNLCAAMFSPSTVNVLPFDPDMGADQARQYAGKYASKAEQHYFVETEKDSVKFFLKARTVGLCMAYNRLMGFRVVRSTRPVKFLHTEFLPPNSGRMERREGHQQLCPAYPDTACYLNFTQKYFYRSEHLRHLRLEQFHRYFAEAGAAEGVAEDDTPGLSGEDYQPPEARHHRHFDGQADAMPPGTKLHSHVHALHCAGGSCRCGVPAARRRADARLGVARCATFELMGDQREKFYEQRLLLTLPWYRVDGGSPSSIAANGDALPGAL